jgi:predicted nucleic acid-binding protein
MAAYYFDSSALVKRYVEERGSNHVERLLSDPATVVYVSRIAGAEVVAAVTRRARGGRVDEGQIADVVRAFREDFGVCYRVQEVTEQLGEDAMDLAYRHAIRGYDAVHLATALDVNLLRRDRALPGLVFVSSDGDLNRAARTEGLEVLDPHH